MHPLNISTSDHLRFGPPDSRHRWGILLACIGAALAVAAVALPNLPNRTVLRLSESGALAGTIGLLAALWGEELSLDMRPRQFWYRKGLDSFCRRAFGRRD